MSSRLSHKANIEQIIFSCGSDNSCKTRPYEVIRTYSHLLNPTDRLLVNLVLEKNCKYAELAALLGISESSLTHRLKRLERLAGRSCLALTSKLPPLKMNESKIARMNIPGDYSIQSIAAQTGLSVYRVRTIISRLKKQTRQ